MAGRKHGWPLVSYCCYKTLLLPCPVLCWRTVNSEPMARAHRILTCSESNCRSSRAPWLALPIRRWSSPPVTPAAWVDSRGHAEHRATARRVEDDTATQPTANATSISFATSRPPPSRRAAGARLERSAWSLFIGNWASSFDAPTPVSNRAPFDHASCEVVEEFRPEVVKFPLWPAGKIPAGSGQSHRRQGAVVGHHRRRSHLAGTAWL